MSDPPVLRFRNGAPNPSARTYARTRQCLTASKHGMPDHLNHPDRWLGAAINSGETARDWET
jgi:hypothetical protein